MKKIRWRIRAFFWRVRAFFVRRYKSPVTNRFKWGKRTVIFLGIPKRFSSEIIEGKWLYQFDEYGTCRGMINMTIFEGLKPQNPKQEKPGFEPQLESKEQK